MKKSILILGTAMFLFAGSVALTSCNNAEKKGKTEEVAENVVEYQCPEKCEGDKTYDEAGKCPECGTELEKIETHKCQKHKGHKHEDHDHEGDDHKCKGHDHDGDDDHEDEDHDHEGHSH